MQILTKKQVKYCRLVTIKSAVREYCLGVNFQDRLFVAERFFAGDRQQQAIDYCQSKYLTDGGATAYLLVSNAAGLTVWQEDKVARVVGKKRFQDLVASLKLDDSIVQIQEIAKICSDRSNSSDEELLVRNLNTSLSKILDLQQQINAGFWQNSRLSENDWQTYTDVRFG